MAVTITATAGSATANSYVTLAEAEAYMLGRLNDSTWTAATDDKKNRALVEATLELDVLSWVGRRTDNTQALSWPRQWAANPDDANGDYYATTAIPVRLKKATEELAFQFLKSGTTDVAALDSTEGITEKTIDVLTTKYAAPFARVRGLKRYPRVWQYIAPLVASPSGVLVPVVRG